MLSSPSWRKLAAVVLSMGLASCTVPKRQYGDCFDVLASGVSVRNATCDLDAYLMEVDGTQRLSPNTDMDYAARSLCYGCLDLLLDIETESSESGCAPPKVSGKALFSSYGEGIFIVRSIEPAPPQDLKSCKAWPPSEILPESTSTPF